MKIKKGRKGVGFQVFTTTFVSIFFMTVCSVLLVKGEALAKNQVSTAGESPVAASDVYNKMSILTPLVVLEASAPKEEEIAETSEQPEQAEETPPEEVIPPEPEEQGFTWSEEDFSAVMYLTSNCNVRSEPRVDSESQGILSNGTQVNVIAKTDKGFYKIENGGFISEEYLTGTAPAPASSRSSVTGTTGYAKLDELIKSIFNSIFTPGMTDADKIRACYNYIIYNTTYQKGMPMPGGFGDTSVEGSDSYVASAAYGCLTTGKGSCNRYSAAFVAMMRVLGYKANYVSGLTRYASGKMDGHAWAEVVISGTPYIFDPQVEDSMLGRGEGNGYTRYWKTYGELGSKYIK